MDHDDQHIIEWDGNIERRTYNRRHTPDELSTVIMTKSPIVNPSIWIPILFASLVGVAGYVMNIHDEQLKIKYHVDTHHDDITEIKNAVKDIQKSVSQNEKHVESIEDTMSELYRQKPR